MTISMLRHCRSAAVTLLLTLGLTMQPAAAAPGDPAGPLANVAQGGVLNHDPYFQDFNSAQGMIELVGGNVVTGWRARDNTAAAPPSPDGNGYGAFFKVSGPTGAAVSGVVAPYLDINAGGVGRQNTPLLAALSGGGFVIVWNSAQGPGDTPAADSFGGDAYGRVYTATGTPVSATFKINESDPNGTEDTQSPAAVIGLTGGGFAVVWSDENDNTGNTDDYFLRVYNASGVPQAASTRLGGAALNPFFEDFGSTNGTGGLIALSNGNLAVSWGARDQNNDGTGVSADGGGGAGFLQVFNASGAPVNAAAVNPYFDVNPDGSGNQDAPLLAPLSGGGFVATWNSNRNTNDPGFVDVGNGNNGTSGGDTYARVFNNSGVGTSSTVRVNDLRTDDSEDPVGVVGLSGGGFAIVWKEGDDATPAPNNNTDDHYARAFSAAGAAVNPSLLIGGAATDALFTDFNGNYGLIALSDGAFATGIRVRDSNNDGSGTSVDGGGYAAAIQIFNANGTARTGSIFPYLDVNPDGSGSQNTPALATVTGGFAITWNSAVNTNDGANSDVGVGGNSTSGGDAWTRIYSNTGTPLRATARVHDTEPTGVADEQRPVGIVKSGANYAVVMVDDNDATDNKDDYFIRVFGDTGLSAPEIVVEQPAGTNIVDGGSRAFGNVALGGNASLVFTVRNTGTSDLTGLGITRSGTHMADFTITANPSAPVAPAGSTTFTVQFAPSAAGARAAALQIASNDADENPFDINLTGTGVALPVLSINDVTVTEGNAGTISANFVVSLNTPALAGGVSFDIATQNGSAIAPADYVARSLAAQTIAAGGNSFAFAVQVNGDQIDEINESFLVNVTNVTGATIGDGQAAGSITDDDTAGIAVVPTNGLMTTEAGVSDNFTVVLQSEPTADVSIGLSSSDPGEGSVLPASLTFTAGNWNVARIVTVAGVDDPMVDGNISYSIVTAASTSTDPNYAGINPADVAVTNNDNDVAGFVITPVAGLVTTEAGTTAAFSVALTSQPSADVSIGLSSTDPGEGLVAPAVLTLTAANWNVAQTVTVTGVDDFVVDGDIAYTIVTSVAASGDGNYSGLNPADVSVTNTDDDVAGIAVTPVSGLVTTEAGGTDSIDFVLTSQPVNDVSIGLSSSDTSEGAVAPATLIFTAANWNVPQTATITGVDDLVDDGDVAYTIVTAAAVSSDGNYSGFNAADAAASNTDDDSAGITLAPTAGLVTTEIGGVDTFSVVLTSQPEADVSIGFSSSDATEGSSTPATLSFSAANWNVPQTVSVAGADDLSFDGDIFYSVDAAAATSADPVYQGILAGSVGVTNLDDETDRTTGPTATGSGNATIVIAGGLCSLDLAQTEFITTDGLILPPIAEFPHGAVRMRAQGCTVGAALNVTITLPTLPTPYAVYKLSPAVIASLVSTTPAGPTSFAYTIVDGGPLDEDGVANGVIVDPVGAGFVTGNQVIAALPAGDIWTWLALGLLILGAAYVSRRKLMRS